VAHWLEIIAKDHKEWIKIVNSFGEWDYAEDIVQEMYLRILIYIEKTDNDITYKGDVNIYFIGKTLKSIFIDHIRKENRKQTLSYDAESYYIGEEDPADFNSAYAKVQQMLEQMYWFDRKVYEIIESGVKISELADKTSIPYYTIYNTYKKVKNHLKNNI